MIENDNLALLNQIDSELTNQLIILKEIIEKLDFEPIASFVLTNEIGNICDKSFNYPGIYLFEVKNEFPEQNINDWMVQFSDLWSNTEYHREFVSNIKKKRVLFHKKISDWVPIYLGKNKKVGMRVNEHIHKELHKKTFAMKLKARKNLYNLTFRVSVIPVNVINYDIIVPQIEAALREKINPIIGRQ